MLARCWRPKPTKDLQHRHVDEAHQALAPATLLLAHVWSFELPPLTTTRLTDLRPAAGRCTPGHDILCRSPIVLLEVMCAKASPLAIRKPRRVQR